MLITRVSTCSTQGTADLRFLKTEHQQNAIKRGGRRPHGLVSGATSAHRSSVPARGLRVQGALSRMHMAPSPLGGHILARVSRRKMDACKISRSQKMRCRGLAAAAHVPLPRPLKPARLGFPVMLALFPRHLLAMCHLRCTRVQPGWCLCPRFGLFLVDPSQRRH